MLETGRDYKYIRYKNEYYDKIFYNIKWYSKLPSIMCEYSGWTYEWATNDLTPFHKFICDTSKIQYDAIEINEIDALKILLTNNFII